MIGLQGIFKLCDTYGYPLEMALQKIHSEDMAIDWEEYVKDAKVAGWSKDKAYKSAHYAMWDVYYKDMPAISVRLKHLVERIYT